MKMIKCNTCILVLLMCLFACRAIEVIPPHLSTLSALVETQPTKFIFSEFSDNRPESDKLGYRRNSFDYVPGMDIDFIRPAVNVDVLTLVQQSIVNEFTRNGHSFVTHPDEEDLIIKGSLESFWVEYFPNISQVLTTVSIKLSVINPTNNKEIFKADYIGISKKNRINLEDENPAIKEAFENLIRSVSIDQQLRDWLIKQSSKKKV